VDDPLRSLSLVAQLRRHFVRHNVQVVSIALLTLVTSLILWALTYFVSAWLTLLGATVIQGVRGDEVTMPRSFQQVFTAFAAAFLLAAIIRRSLIRNDMPTEKGVLEHGLDILLAIPASTVAIWGNLSAWLWLSDRELSAAADLLERITRNKRLPLHITPVEIPDDAERKKVLFSLLMTGLLDLRKEKGVPYLQLAPAETLDEDLGRLLTDGQP
jgi:hypothetical protein